MDTFIPNESTIPTDPNYKNEQVIIHENDVGTRDNSDFAQRYELAQLQLQEMAKGSDIEVSIKDLIDIMTTLLEGIGEEEGSRSKTGSPTTEGGEELFTQSQILLSQLQKNEKVDDNLLVLFGLHEPFSYIVPSLRYQLGYSIQNDEECILHLKNLKSTLDNYFLSDSQPSRLAKPTSGSTNSVNSKSKKNKNKDKDCFSESTQFLDRLITFLSSKDGNFDVMDVMKLTTSSYLIKDDNLRNKCHDCVDYIESTTN